jgi:hypothetical protein
MILIRWIRLLECDLRVGLEDLVEFLPPLSLSALRLGLDGGMLCLID